MAQQTKQQSASLHPAVAAGRPPVVAVLGHVDHGKTTLLDCIRKSDVAAREHGGITQHVGAYQVQVKRQTAKGKSEEGIITFIDTPGHEAFAKMRSRGAQIADIAVLVVAADDSVMPQTIESIRQVKEAGIPMIVAVNKVDLPTANADRVKQDLAKHEVQVEGFGGDVPIQLISAKQGTGIPELLDLILLVAEMKGLVSEPAASLEVPVIETKVDRGKGKMAMVVVKKGTLKPGMMLYEGAIVVGKVRAMFDEQGGKVTEAPPGKPVEILGFDKLPSVGSVLREKPETPAQPKAPPQPRTRDVADILAAMEEAEKKKLTLVLKADTMGSLEAIIGSLPRDRIDIVRPDLGDITEADILEAKATKALVVGFNVKASSAIRKLAQVEKVVFRTYSIIYELLKELGEVIEGLEEVLVPERELGRGQVVAEFPYRDDRVAGIKVVSGRLARGDNVRMVREETEVGRAKIRSMRHGKEDITKMEVGGECGVLLDRKVDFLLGDGIIAITTG